MYLKRAPASSGRAVLRCGMSWGPSAAGGSPTSAALSLLCEFQVKLIFCRNKTQYFSTFKMKTWKAHLVKVLALEILLQYQLSSIPILLGFLVKEAFVKHSFLWIFSLQKQRDSQQHNIIIRNNCGVGLKRRVIIHELAVLIRNLN